MHNVVLSPIDPDKLIDSIAERVTANILQAVKDGEFQNKKEAGLRSVKELASHCGVAELTVRNWIKEGRVQAKTIGRRIFIEEDEFQAALHDVKSMNYRRA